MLRLARFRACRGAEAESFNPRKDGPLIDAGDSETTVAERAGAGADGVADVSGTGGFGAATDTAGGGLAMGAALAKSDAPHMPQKRFWSGFSLPQRGQRTNVS